MDLKHSCLTCLGCDPQMQCQDLRKRKNLELQILSEPVRGWDGDSIKSLGQVSYMSQVQVQSGSSEVRADCANTQIPCPTHRNHKERGALCYLTTGAVLQLCGRHSHSSCMC